MKIVVGLPSRGRAIEMAASAISLYRTATGHNDVTVMLMLDDDDGLSIDIGTAVARVTGAPNFRVESHVGPRVPALGELHNRVIELMSTEAAYLMWSDRISMLGAGWDQQLAIGVMQHPTQPLWIDSIHLVGPGQVILPPAWRAAMDGPCFPAVSPFWQDDTAVEELQYFVHGMTRMRLEAQCCGPRAQKTNRCRDIEFWWDVFAATRPQRIARARRMCERFGLPFHNPAAIVAAREQVDASMKARAVELFAQFGEAGEPDASYLEAKRQAEVLMAEIAAERQEVAA